MWVADCRKISSSMGGRQKSPQQRPLIQRGSSAVRKQPAPAAKKSCGESRSTSHATKGARAATRDGLKTATKSGGRPAPPGSMQQPIPNLHCHRHNESPRYAMKPATTSQDRNAGGLGRGHITAHWAGIRFLAIRTPIVRPARWAPARGRVSPGWLPRSPG